MKNVFAVLVLIGVVGCAAVPYPTSDHSEDWQNFGQNQALDGQIKLSAKRLANHAPQINEALYHAYSQGYQIGQEEYCDQNAQQLGISGRIYRGICDKIDPSFQMEYDQGRAISDGDFY